MEIEGSEHQVHISIRERTFLYSVYLFTMCFTVAIQVPPFSGPSPLQALPRLHHRRREKRGCHLGPAAILRAERLVPAELLRSIMVTGERNDHRQHISLRNREATGKGSVE